MAQEVVISGELAERARQLTGLPTARAAAEAVLREYVRGQDDAAANNNGAEQAPGQSQFDRIRASALAIAERGDPFYPGFNYKDLRGGRACVGTEDQAEDEDARKERIARQNQRILDGALAIARRGSPFYPGFDHKKLRKNRDFS